MPRVGKSKFAHKLVALDSETTGVDTFHGAKPFLVTVCLGDDTLWWEWDVCPIIRQPKIPVGDVAEIQEALDSAEEIVGQNLKFDGNMLAEIGIRLDWHKVHDTLCAGHILGTNLKHDLYSMLIQYCGEDLSHLEDQLEEAVNEARAIVRKDYCGKVLHVGRNDVIQQQEWRIAREGLPEMPSAKAAKKKKTERGVESDKPWKFDCWLPRAIALERMYQRPDSGCEHQYRGWECSRCGGHRWWTICREYANGDSAGTLLLWEAMTAQLTRRKLWKIYKSRLGLLPIAANLERRGVTLSLSRLDDLRQRYTEASEESKAVCVGIARDIGANLKFGKTINNSLREFVFGERAVKEKTGGSGYTVKVEKCPGLGLEPVAWSKESGAPSLNKDVLEEYEDILPQGSPALAFIKELRAIGSMDTAVRYLDQYVRYQLPTVRIAGDDGASIDGPLEWYRLHPGANPFGTDHLRWAFSNPNAANISKKENFNLRYCFGPAPGREWWSLDAQNIELRIPAFESDERELVEVFLEPNKPPYFGSYHLVIFDLLHPEKFAEHGKNSKEVYESTWYQWVKNFNFALLYGCQERKGDQTAHVQGAYRQVKHRFKRMSALADRMMAMGERLGYIETMPDKTVDPERGYPILCGRTKSGGIMPTTPLNYHVSGSACWWMAKAMMRCTPQLEEWQRNGFDAFITLQIHDELVFDMPKRAHPLKNPKASNLGRVRVLQKLMEMGGDDFGFPTPVSIEFNEYSWDKGVRLVS